MPAAGQVVGEQHIAGAEYPLGAVAHADFNLAFQGTHLLAARGRMPIDEIPGLVAAEFDLTLNTPDQAAIVAEALQQGEAEQEEAERQALADEEQALIDANRAKGFR